MSRGERETVPRAEFRSYYGHPIIKEPAWKVPDVPLYLFLGGLSGVSASTAAVADLTGSPGLARATRYIAAASVAASVGALVHGLGRPERFLYMLRVFKVTSPLSVGSWLLAPFSAAAAGAAASQLTGRLPRLGRAAGIAAGILGPAMATYTAVLLSDTAVPAWHEYYRRLPFVFAGGALALASAGGAALMAAPLAEQTALGLRCATRSVKPYTSVADPSHDGEVLAASARVAVVAFKTVVAARSPAAPTRTHRRRPRQPRQLLPVTLTQHQRRSRSIRHTSF